jgi:hypothetical protein
MEPRGEENIGTAFLDLFQNHKNVRLCWLPFSSADKRILLQMFPSFLYYTIHKTPKCENLENMSCACAQPFKLESAQSHVSSFLPWSRVFGITCAMLEFIRRPR